MESKYPKFLKLLGFKRVYSIEVTCADGRKVKIQREQKVKRWRKYDHLYTREENFIWEDSPIFFLTDLITRRVPCNILPNEYSLIIGFRILEVDKSDYCIHKFRAENNYDLRDIMQSVEDITDDGFRFIEITDEEYSKLVNG